MSPEIIVKLFNHENCFNWQLITGKNCQIFQSMILFENRNHHNKEHWWPYLAVGQGPVHLITGANIIKISEQSYYSTLKWCIEIGCV